ncbi:MAG: sodium-dependent transporter [Waddliaceae bacterium]
MKREHWGSRLGFILSVAGSAIGLANIWRLPYLVGKGGGAVFLFLYLICLLLIGFPVLISEILIGRNTEEAPGMAFEKIGKSKWWGMGGRMTILTGFMVSTFYSAVAGWIMGYWIEAITGHLQFTTFSEASDHYNHLVSNPFWCIGFHFAFQLICVGVLFYGVRQGIERWNKILMPMLFAILIILVIKGLSQPGAEKGLEFLFKPDWSKLTPAMGLMALGQSFFTLSLGQGTMVTYGSYLNRKESLIKTGIPVVIMDTVVALLAAVAVFTIVFSGGAEPASGPGLIFNTLPVAWSQMPGGTVLASAFFFLVFIAAVTSEISAMEPTIAYLMDEKKFKRKNAVLLCGSLVFLVGIPSALSYSIFNGNLIGDMNFLESMDFICSSILIPFGGFLAVVLVGWKWGLKKALPEIRVGSESVFDRYSFIPGYFWVCLKYTAPILIIFVFLNSIGVI